MDMRPLLRILAIGGLLVALVLAFRLAFRARSAWPSRRTSGIAAGVLAALALAGFVLSSLDLLEPRAPLPGSATLYYIYRSNTPVVNEDTLVAAAAATGVVRWQDPLGTDTNSGAPTLDRGVLYLAVSKSIRAVDASDGKQLWETPVPGATYARTPAVDQDVVYVASYAGVSALRASDGSLLWNQPWTGATIVSLPYVTTGVVYAAMTTANATPSDPPQQATIYALRATNGTILWKYTMLGAIYGDLTVAEGAVYTTFTPAGLVALDAADGALRWQRQNVGSFLPPAVASGVVYTVGTSSNDSYPQETVEALDARDGHEHWSAPAEDHLPGSASMTVAGNTLYVGGASVYALAISDGHQLWRYGSNVQFSRPVVADGVVFVVSSSWRSIDFSDTSYLTALDARSGTLYWRTPSNDDALASSIAT
jgi:outer membrane protein assembly factor BamB